MTAQRRSHRLARAVAAAAGAVALAAAPAMARPIDGPNEPVRPVPVELEQAPVVQEIDDGFDWGSAAIGAGGAGALLVLGSAAGFAYTSRHRVRAAR